MLPPPPSPDPESAAKSSPRPCCRLRTKQERSARTRTTLIRSAAEQFEHHGFERTRLSEVSEGAGVTSGALYFHFSNKQELADAVEASAIRGFYRAARHTRRTRAAALAQLIDLSHAFAGLLREDVVARAGLRLNSDATPRTRLSLRQEWQGCVQHLLVRAAEEGSLSDGVSLHTLGEVVVAATTGFAVLGRDNGEWVSRETLRDFWRFSLPCAAVADGRPATD
ncbi:ScbR family autoregulator-binding transcription factor [Streptomyces sp. AC602_WCS936]|uniref:ScbR family autoregulator-binding transcription factor n=1 Tax=Streptomyces sp. AC602_WCS936 TaxID=2823685 RepID=UPI001C2718E9|nr:ScbR family autoregulator-binding transcription factor [Streptomyces sp. AC602_WCS936]